jgi:hypothetical protein
VVLDEEHHRPAGAVVEQRVDVERRDDLARQRLQEVFAGEPARRSSVDEPGERLDQHRPAQLRQVAGELVEILRIGHHALLVVGVSIIPTS